MHEDLGHRNDDGEFWNTIVDGHASQDFRLPHQPRLPADAQRVVEARNHEQDPDAGAGDNTHQAVETVVAGPIRYRQRMLIKDFDAADRIAPGADIGPAIQILSADAEERRPPAEGARVLV